MEQLEPELELGLAGGGVAGQRRGSVCPELMRGVDSGGVIYVGSQGTVFIVVQQ